MNFLDFRSHKTQLVATALAASVVTAGAFHAYNTHARNARRRDLDREIRQSLARSDEDLPSRPLPIPFEAILSASKGAPNYDEDLIKEQLARNYAFFGDEGMAKIRKGTVVIVGCGGVGSWAAVMLVRSFVSFFFFTVS